MSFYYPRRYRSAYERAPARHTLYGNGAYYRKAASAPRTVSRRLRGNGSYTLENGPWANRGAAIGSLIGRQYGGPAGAAVGSYIGRRAFHYPAKIFGSGDYTVTQPVTKGVEKMAPVPAKFESNSEGVCITHREYLGDLITSSTAGELKLDTFDINPAMSHTFPWLSTLCESSFQQYKFEGLVFEFKSFSADALNSTNTALGSVFSCINYDWNDSPFTSRAQIENSDWSMACKPSDNMMIPVECKPRLTSMNGLLYVLNGNSVPVGADPKTYFLGKLTVGTKGFQGTSVNIGSLYVTYKVRLYKPIMMEPAAGSLIYSAYRSGATSSAHFGTALVSAASNCDSFGVTYEASNTRLRINHKRLQTGMRLCIMWMAWGNATASTALPTDADTNLTGAGFWPDNSFNPYLSSGSDFGKINTTSSDRILMVRFYEVEDGDKDATITLSGGTLPANSFAQITIMQICGTPLDKIGDYQP